jgi:hypothetical protein
MSLLCVSPSCYVYLNVFIKINLINVKQTLILISYSANIISCNLIAKNGHKYQKLKAIKLQYIKMLLTVFNNRCHYEQLSLISLLFRYKFSFIFNTSLRIKWNNSTCCNQRLSRLWFGNVQMHSWMDLPTEALEDLRCTGVRSNISLNRVASGQCSSSSHPPLQGLSESIMFLRSSYWIRSTELKFSEIELYNIYHDDNITQLSSSCYSADIKYGLYTLNLAPVALKSFYRNEERVWMELRDWTKLLDILVTGCPC